MGAEITLVNALKIVGGDGTVQWVAANQLGRVYKAVATSAITQGQALQLDSAGANPLVIPRQDYLATESAPAEYTPCKPLDATKTNGPPIGVALTKAAAAAQVAVAGPDSIVAVKANAAGAVGNLLVGSVAVAAGSVLSQGTAAPGLTLGVQTLGSITGGAGTQVGVLVSIQ